MQSTYTLAVPFGHALCLRDHSVAKEVTAVSLC